mmetsp:Transcript_21675/g.73436  ORF Transcript_21675/g.73436 Transcript_21675/m.73436 type:complete len:212 (+) Transcript_21675:1807-2442(+)
MRMKYMPPAATSQRFQTPNEAMPSARRSATMVRGSAVTTGAAAFATDEALDGDATLTVAAPALSGSSTDPRAAAAGAVLGSAARGRAVVGSAGVCRSPWLFALDKPSPFHPSPAVGSALWLWARESVAPASWAWRKNVSFGSPAYTIRPVSSNKTTWSALRAYCKACVTSTTAVPFKAPDSRSKSLSKTKDARVASRAERGSSSSARSEFA